MLFCPVYEVGDGGGSNAAHALQTIFNEAKAKKNLFMFFYLCMHSVSNTVAI